MRTQIATTLGIAAFLLAGCETAPKSDAEKLIAVWRGHTVEFTVWPDKVKIGHGYYYPSSNKLLYQDRFGRCYFARYKIEGNIIAYDFPNAGTSVFRVEERDGVLASVQRDGVYYQTGKIISDQKIACTPQNLN